MVSSFCLRTMYYVIRYEPELYHYGVKGMRWGVRHDPERVGHKRRTKESSNNSTKKRKLSKAAKIALGLTATAVVLGTTAYLIKSGKGNRLISIGKKAIGSEKFSGHDIDLDAVMGAKFNKVSESTNKIDSFFETNPYHKTLLGSETNCTCCAIADWFKDKGYEAKAAMAINVDPLSGLAKSRNYTLDDIAAAFPGAKPKTVTGASVADIRKSILKTYPNGGSGVFGTTFLDANGVATRHAIKWKIDNGSVIFSDSQSAPSLLKEAVKRGADEQKAKRFIHQNLSNMSDDYLKKFIDMSSKKEIINLEDASDIIYDEVRKFIY